MALSDLFNSINTGSDQEDRFSDLPKRDTSSFGSALRTTMPYIARTSLQYSLTTTSGRVGLEKLIAEFTMVGA